jgi:hypothetical protein
VTDRKKWKDILFDRPKPTAGCSANGRRRIRNVTVSNLGPNTNYPDRRLMTGFNLNGPRPLLSTHFYAHIK